jgi:UDP-2,3-diacylglucosamine pyrophosphatase LpxH
VKILFIQIGDIHWRNDKPVSDDKFTAVGSSIRRLSLDDPKCIFFVYTGDFAHAGKSEEYLEVYRQLDELENEVRSNFKGVITYRVGVPGNHDCDFNVDQSAREQLLAFFEKTSTPALKGKIVDVVAAVQDNYWDFADAFIHESNQVHPLWDDVDPKLAWFHEFSIDSKKIRFKCFNTAWLSKLHEKQGALLLPVKQDLSREPYDLDLSLFHHPLTWIESINSRTSREHLLASSDILFTGHEHEVGTFRLEIDQTGEASVYEGGALWEPKAQTHEFSTLLLNIEDITSEFTEFRWESQKYQAYRDGAIWDPGNYAGPRPLQLNRFRRNSVLDFTPEHKKFLERAEIDLTHGKQAKLSLSDLFIFPDLSEMAQPGLKREIKTIEGPKARDFLLSKDRVVLAGANGSGKTALLKRWSQEAKSQGLLPVYLNGREIPSGEPGLMSHINSQIRHQFGGASENAFFSSPLDERVVVVDDYDKSTCFWFKGDKLVEFLKGWFGKIVIAGHDLSFGPLQIGKFLAGDEVGRTAVIILPLSTDRQNELIEKWLNLDQDLVDDPVSYSRRFHEINVIMNSVIGREYVQPYPPYVLALLQGSEAGVELDLTTSTHGFLYEVFIKNALAKRSSGTNHNIFTSFVSFLAFKCLKEERKQFGVDFFGEVHTWFENATDLVRNIDVLKAELLQLRFLSQEDDSFQFAEKYIYYYFVAFYIKDYLSVPEVSEFVEEMASKLWVEDYANVMLFLTHLSKDRHIAKSVINAAKNIFRDIRPATLEEDALEFFHRMASETVLEIPNNGESTPESRREEAEQVANEIKLPSSDYVTDGRDVTFEQVSEIAKLNASVKTIQILGQMLKNFPANFSPQEKVDIINSCIDLGMRTFTSYLNLVGNDQQQIIREFAEMLRVRNVIEKEELLADEARRIVFQLVYLVAFGLTKRVSYAIGSSELSRPYERIFSGEIPASRKLVKLSLALDHAGKFPELLVEEATLEWKKSNPFALQILKGMVKRHFKQFHVGFATRQRVCAILDISFKKVIAVPSGRKIIRK